MPSKDAHLYNPKAHNLTNGTPLSTSNSLSFSSHLSSLINTSTTANQTSRTSTRLKPKKDDLFRQKPPKGNTAKRAKLDHSDNPAFAQTHTTEGETLDPAIWERSKRRMQEKARLYAAMKRGDVEDEGENYAVDFDRKWAESSQPHADAAAAAAASSPSNTSSDDDEEDREERVEYTDEFGRTRTGTRGDIARLQRAANARTELAGDRFTARPSAPANVIVGDTIQHGAFNPDADVASAMETLAKKRDRSLTPPEAEHFDGKAEVRRKGTGFYQFSAEEGERGRQMEGLEGMRAQTERVRKEREGRVEERRRVVEERRAEVRRLRGEKRADVFLQELGVELGGKPTAAAGEIEKTEASREGEDEGTG